MGAFVGNLEGFRKTIAHARAKVEGTATARYQKFVKQVLRDLARNTPQWSGDLAASWQVIVGKDGFVEDLGYTSLKKDFNPGDKAVHFLGDRTAVNLAVKLNIFNLQKIRWNSKVRIENVSTTITTGDDDTGPVREEMLREGNYHRGDIMAVQHVANLHRTSKFTAGMTEDD